MKTQHHHPCAECPFSRTVPVGTTGGSDPEVYVGQAMGPFLLACHMDPDYYKDRRSPENLQCAGAAAFRANISRAEMMPAAMLHCPPDTERCFATPAELIAHHRQIPLAEAEEILRKTPPELLLMLEFRKAGVSRVDMPKPP